jgi:ATP-dependent Clp protease protease subunit
MQITYDIGKGFKNAKVEDLIFDPMVVRVGDFDDKALTQFITDFNKAINSGQPVVPILINSYGGYVDSLTAMMTMVETSPIPVATICTGWAMSCGLCLFACGTKGMRYMAPNARLMMHEISSCACGKEKEITASSDEVKRLNKWLFEQISKKCGHRPGYFMELMKEKSNADWYLTPKEAKKHNLANVIGVPSMKVKARVEMEFGL